MAVSEEELFLQLTLILTVAVASHFVMKRLRQPTIIGEIAIGVILGPSVVGFILNGWQPPPAGAVGILDPELVTIFAALGAIFLLFLIGLEMDTKAIYERNNVIIALGGVTLPWVFGFVVAYLMVPDSSLVVNGLPIDRFAMATFVGAILVATSVAIAAAILRELGMIRTKVAETIMGAAIVDDILGLMVLSLAIGISGGAFDVLTFIYLVVVAVAFIAVGLYIGARYFGRLVVWTHVRGLKVGLTHSGFMLALATAFLMAFVAEAIGLSAIIGAFLAGAMFTTEALRKDFRQGVEFLGSVFMPIFFISLGLLVNIWTLTTDLLLFGGVLLLAAWVSKTVGCGGPARLLGLSKEESSAIAYGMTPRGEVGLVIALAAVQAGVIGPDLFSIIVIVLVVVSVLPSPLLRRNLLAIERKRARGPGTESRRGEEQL
jgi:Kef-type K+ transport system membrane component KefB